MHFENFLEGLTLAFIGVTVVFSVLLTLQFSIASLHHGLALLERFTSRQPSAPPVQAPSVSENPPQDVDTTQNGEATLEEVAAIGAAVAAIFGRHARILHLQPLEVDGQSAWARQGRLEIMGSHVVPRDGR